MFTRSTPPSHHTKPRKIRTSVSKIGFSRVADLAASLLILAGNERARENGAASMRIAVVQPRGTIVADNQYSEQKSTLVIRVPLSEESYASIYFSNHEGRPMNAREWWHLKQVVELASHAFMKPEDKPQGATQAMVAGA
jgi:hypothetical protein